MEGIGKVEGIIPFPFFNNLSKGLLETLGSVIAGVGIKEGYVILRSRDNGSK